METEKEEREGFSLYRETAERLGMMAKSCFVGRVEEERETVR